MENISYGDRVTDDLQLRSRAKTKKAMRSVQAKAYEYGSRSCSILNDRLKKEYLRYGGVAQLGEHLPCKQGVMGSIPIISTKGER